jgi:2-polyprenyl-6-methoxyphenol hydroxylase-like FAD-dependent oxidoreductase
MIRAAQDILIIGGGFSGMAAAIELRKLGAHVDLVEIDPGWRSYGAGISLGGATLRAFRQLGILEAFFDRGNAADGVALFLPHGQPIGVLPTCRAAAPSCGRCWPPSWPRPRAPAAPTCAWATPSPPSSRTRRASA